MSDYREFTTVPVPIRNFLVPAFTEVTGMPMVYDEQTKTYSLESTRFVRRVTRSSIKEDLYSVLCDMRIIGSAAVTQPLRSEYLFLTSTLHTAIAAVFQPHGGGSWKLIEGDFPTLWFQNGGTVIEGITRAGKHGPEFQYIDAWRVPLADNLNIQSYSCSQRAALVHQLYEESGGFNPFALVFPPVYTQASAAKRVAQTDVRGSFWEMQRVQGTFMDPRFRVSFFPPERMLLFAKRDNALVTLTFGDKVAVSVNTSYLDTSVERKDHGGDGDTYWFTTPFLRTLVSFWNEHAKPSEDAVLQLDPLGDRVEFQWVELGSRACTTSEVWSRSFFPYEVFSTE